MNIYFGSVTGTAENVARETAKLAQSRGHKVAISELDDLSIDQLEELDDLVIVIATYGEGEMPFNAELFWDELNAEEPDLEGLTYAVLGLGDSAYEQFCQAGKDIDARLEELGAQRRLKRVDCDLNYEKAAQHWMEHAVPKSGGEPGMTEGEAISKTAEAEPEPWSRRKPFPATIKENRRLSGAGSTKQINHIVLDINGSGFEYEAGDSIAVIPRNDPDLVAAFLDRFDETADSRVEGYDETLGVLLESRFEITTPSERLLRAVASVIKDDALSQAVSGGHGAMEAFRWNMDILDVLNIDPRLKVPPDVLFGLLQPLQHRAYSIASTPVVSAGEVHLTVASVRWEYLEREHRGACSTMLTDRSAAGAQVSTFMVPNKRFRLPEDDAAPIIMIGPGTGVAPFIGFLDERQQKGAEGDAWLFFGDRQQSQDFIYEEKLKSFQDAGTLSRLDCAFSRDADQKVYVQDRLREAGAEVVQWLDRGAWLYICGDAKRMAPDVEATLREVVAEHGGCDAEKYVSNLRREGRYHKDVY